MVSFNCGIIAYVLLILSGQSEARSIFTKHKDDPTYEGRPLSKDYPGGGTVLELTNDCGKCALDTCFNDKMCIPGTPSSCKNGPGGNDCINLRRRNIRALTESESNYSKNEGETSEVAKSDVIHKSESSSSDLQRDLREYHQDNRYVFVRLGSIGDVRRSEASVDNVVLKINDSGTNALSNRASTFDGVSWNWGVSPDWNIFSNGTTFMTDYGTLRPWGGNSSWADIYGDQEGIWTRVKIEDSEEKIEKLSLSVSLKFGRGNTNPRRYYKIEVGTGSKFTNGDNFTVLAEATVAPTYDKPGNTFWETFTASWQRWKEMTLNTEDCEYVANMNEDNREGGVVERQFHTEVYNPNYDDTKICGGMVADRGTIILIACEQFPQPTNSKSSFRYYKDTTDMEIDNYENIATTGQRFTVCGPDV